MGARRAGGKPSGNHSEGEGLSGTQLRREDVDPLRHMEADLYNLQPSIGEVNQLRSNYSMAMIDGETRKFGSCDLEIEDRKIEPRPDIRGDIARTYFYMDAAYPGRGVISDKNRKLFAVWAREDPVGTRGSASGCAALNTSRAIQTHLSGEERGKA
jgi:deoxyribonuclease I